MNSSQHIMSRNIPDKQCLVVSILIPVYNTATYLAKCLDSIINQTYSNIEIIVVNDGSTDNSLDILKKYASMDSRIILINQGNTGLQGARQAAIDIARGDYICFVDSDDTLPHRTVIETMLKATSDQIKVAVGRINIDNGQSKTLFPSRVFTVIDSQKYIRYLLSGQSGWNIAGKLYHASLIKNYQGTPIKVTAGEDALYTIRLMSSITTNIAMVNIPVYNYYMRPGSITKSQNVKYIYDNFKVADYIEESLSGTIADKYLVAFRLLCMSNSFHYGWLGSKHPLNVIAIQSYKKTKGVLPLYSIKKAIQIWILIHFGDIASKFIFKNQIK